ncbi:hypothetical protein [Undibacterium sp. WLX3042]|uniref:hypothetical protein n=1 Tax=Undibacterium sp. WLX3042 TaxID=3412686 RepID=UPI003C2BBA7E
MNRGHEIIPKGICHDRYDDHEKTSQKERTIQRTWKLAANQFAIMFGERFTNAIN